MDENVENQPATVEDNRGWMSLVPVVLVFVAMVVFVLQNTHETGVEFLTLDQTAPTWLLIVISAIAGAVLGQAAAFMRRRSKRSS